MTKLTENEIQIENIMAELTDEITSIYIDRSYRVAASYTAKVPNYIISQEIETISYGNDSLLILTKTGNTYRLKLSGLGAPQYIGDDSIHVEEWDTQEVLYEN